MQKGRQVSTTPTWFLQPSKEGSSQREAQISKPREVDRQTDKEPAGPLHVSVLKGRDEGETGTGLVKNQVKEHSGLKVALQILEREHKRFCEKKGEVGGGVQMSRL